MEGQSGMGVTTLVALTNITKNPTSTKKIQRYCLLFRKSCENINDVQMPIYLVHLHLLEHGKSRLELVIK